MKIFHVMIDTKSGSNPLSDVSVEKSFFTREQAAEYIDRHLSDMDPDFIDITYSYIDGDICETC